ncbi:hypothetical protein ONZ45_g5312 [Pleurotus djamor]|nr:hypothetical protein ONZ45_g5312 [Pleurotus djamor]
MTLMHSSYPISPPDRQFLTGEELYDFDDVPELGSKRVLDILEELISTLGFTKPTITDPTPPESGFAHEEAADSDTTVVRKLLTDLHTAVSTLKQTKQIDDPTSSEPTI